MGFLSREVEALEEEVEELRKLIPTKKPNWERETRLLIEELARKSMYGDFGGEDSEYTQIMDHMILRARHLLDP